MIKLLTRLIFCFYAIVGLYGILSGCQLILRAWYQGADTIPRSGPHITTFYLYVLGSVLFTTGSVYFICSLGILFIKRWARRSLIFTSGSVSVILILNTLNARATTKLHLSSYAVYFLLSFVLLLPCLYLSFSFIENLFPKKYRDLR